jgi:hypothetical protein
LEYPEGTQRRAKYAPKYERRQNDAYHYASRQSMPNQRGRKLRARERRQNTVRLRAGHVSVYERRRHARDDKNAERMRVFSHLRQLGHLYLYPFDVELR